MSKHSVTRREFIRAAGWSALTLFTPVAIGEAAEEGPLFAVDAETPPSDVFSLGVASGDPTSSGVILWTRIDPEAYQPGLGMAFQVALDAAFNWVVLAGVVDGGAIGADRDYTIKLDLDGQLAANRRYFYRFIYAGVASVAGRCRTLPAPSASPAEIRLGLLTCQDYPSGYYGALHHLAQEDVDFVVHLGDFIYEQGSESSDFPDRNITLPSGNSVAVDLGDYRHLYRTYRTDPFLQEVMARHTFIVIWDDHEFANDSYWDPALDAPGAPDHPFAADPEALRQLKLDSQRAWAEYVPARPEVNPEATHPHDFLSIWRRFRFGDLLDLFMLDERTYRSPHPCGEALVGGRYVSPGCDQQDSPDQTMLGVAQRQWLIGGLVTSPAIWKALGNEVLQMALTIPRPNQGSELFVDLDAWDGYRAERLALLHTVRQAGVRNLVLLTGDLHAYMAGYVKLDYGEANNGNPENVVGVEFMTPAVSSDNLGAVLADLGFEGEIGEGLIRLMNPHVRFADLYHWGYATVTFGRRACTYRAYSVDRTVNDANVPRTLLKELRVLRNRTRLFDLTGAASGAETMAAPGAED